MTEPLFNLPAIQRTTQEVVFEHFGFRAMHAEPAPVLALHNHAAENRGDAVAQSLSGVVVEAGFSFTHAVPIFDGAVQLDAVRRVNVGGKVLTNLLKELVRVLIAAPRFCGTAHHEHSACSGELPQHEPEGRVAAGGHHQGRRQLRVA